MATKKAPSPRQRYWDFPTKTTIADLIGTVDDEWDDDGSFSVTWDNKAMRGYRVGRKVLAYTMEGEPGKLVMFDWPEDGKGKVAGDILGRGATLEIETIDQLRAMARAWAVAGRND